MKPSRNSLRKKLHTQKLVRSIYKGEPYEYYPLGKYVVSAPDVCGGRLTFIYTRLEVAVILSLIAAGDSIEDIVDAYSHSGLKPQAIKEAILRL